MMFDKKILLIINPKAGKGRGSKKIDEILRIFQNGGFLTTVLLTEKAGDAKEVVINHGKDYDIIACVGGDGTFSQVMSGIVEAKLSQPIGYLPAGSANDYGASLNLSTDLCTAASDLVTGVPTPFDIGYFNGQPFAYVVAFGTFAKVSYSTPQDLKNTLGHLAYVLEGIKDLQSLSAMHVHLKLDGEEVEGDYILGFISNAISIGGILRFNPEEINLNDGYLELLLISMPSSAWDFTQLIQALSTQTYTNCSAITFRRAREIKIRADAQMPWTLDGEYVQGSEEILITNSSSAIKVMIPSNAE